MLIISARCFVYATDLAQSLQFYTQVLHLRLVERIVGGVILAAGALEVELLQDRRDTEPSIDRRTGLILFVDDVDATYAALQDQNVIIASELAATSDGAQIFYVVDPDGLPIGIRSEAPSMIAPGDWLRDEP